MANPNDVSLFFELSRTLTYEELDTNFSVLKELTTEYNEFLLDRDATDDDIYNKINIVQGNLDDHTTTQAERDNLQDEATALVQSNLDGHVLAQTQTNTDLVEATSLVQSNLDDHVSNYNEYVLAQALIDSNQDDATTLVQSNLDDHILAQTQVNVGLSEATALVQSNLDEHILTQTQTNTDLAEATALVQSNLDEHTTLYDEYVLTQTQTNTDLAEATALVQSNLTEHTEATNPHDQYTRKDIRSSVKGIDYAMVEVNIVDNAVELNLTDGNYFKLEAVGDVTLTIKNPPSAGKTTKLILYVSNTDGLSTVVWPVNVIWSDVILTELGEEYSLYELTYIDSVVGWIGCVLSTK